MKMSKKRPYPVLIVAALAVTAAAASTPVAARWVNPDTAGYCASGTCNRAGGIRARNVKFCKAENCRDFAAANLKTVAITRTAPCQASPATVMVWPWSWFWPRRDCGPSNEK
jgi:hypothetical protein